MNTFSKNVENYKQSLNITDSELIELTDLTLETFSQLIDDPFSNLKALYQFCFNLELNFESLFSESGFVTATLSHQFNTSPNMYKKIVSKHWIKYLIKRFGKDELKNRLTATGHYGKTNKIIVRLLNGTSTLNWVQIEMILKEVLADVDSRELEFQLACIMYSKIPNFNYTTGRSYYNLKYADIAEELNITPSSAGNWGGFTATTIPAPQIELIAELLGGFSREQFTTTFLTTSDFKTRRCRLTLGSRLPDPPIDDKLSDSIQTEVTIDEPIDEPEPIKQMKLTESQGKINTISVEIDEEKGLRMFSQLSTENKAKVFHLVIELFLAQL